MLIRPQFLLSTDSYATVTILVHLIYDKLNTSRQFNQKYSGNSYKKLLQVRSMLSKTH